MVERKSIWSMGYDLGGFRISGMNGHGGLGLVGSKMSCCCYQLQWDVFGESGGAVSSSSVSLRCQSVWISVVGSVSGLVIRKLGWIWDDLQ